MATEEDVFFGRKLQSDEGFMRSPEARQLRVLYELNVPRLRFSENEIENTVVFFGSARIPSLEKARSALKVAKDACAKEDNAANRSRLAAAEADHKMAHYYEGARELSKKISEWSLEIEDKKNRFYICSGGGPGIMEAANRGAYEAGEPTIGLNISLPFEQHPNPFQTQNISFEFHYFFVRKFWFAYLAKALVVFPGGFGTMDELFELLTLMQTQKIAKKVPIILFGKEFWEQVLNFDVFVKWNLISKEDLDLFTIVDNAEEAFQYIRQEMERYYLNQA